MAKWKIGIAVGVISILLLAWQDVLMSGEGFATVRETKSDGWWCIFEEERVPRTDADTMIVADGQIFLYYDKYALVNAYSTDGAFLRCYQVETVSNGRGGIGYRDGVLYIDGNSGIYGFRGEELVVSEVLYRDDGAKELYRFVDQPDPVTDGGYTYYYNAAAGQVNRARPGEALEPVVQLPVRSSKVDALIYANLGLWVCFYAWCRLSDGKAAEWFETYREGKRRKLH